MFDEEREALNRRRVVIVLKLALHVKGTRVLHQRRLDALGAELHSIEQAFGAMAEYEQGIYPRLKWLRGEVDTRPGLGYMFETEPDMYYMYIRPVPSPSEKPWFLFRRRCYTEICRRTFTRLHFTCLRKCWEHMVWEGKWPPVFRVKEVKLLLRKGRPAWKHHLSKRIISVAEWAIS